MDPSKPDDHAVDVLAKDREAALDALEAMRQDQLSIETISASNAVILRLVGEIDMNTAQAVRGAALSAMHRHGPHLHLDLSGVTFMDSTGLEVLLATRRRTELEGGHLYLDDPSQMVIRVLEVTGVDRLFDIRAGVGGPTEAVK
jgi:stage II sporulation protein AA (anti-sigma F factor antagonist)